MARASEHGMIEDLQVVLHNGRRRSPQRPLSDVPLMAQATSSEYAVVAFEWYAQGHRHTRACDAQTQWMIRAPDGASLVVLQDYRAHGPDNVLVLSPCGTPLRRIENPYPQLPDAHPQADFWFEDIRCDGGHVVLKVFAIWMHPIHRRPAMPSYDAIYDPATWTCLSLQWRPML
ncbi:hypothetical protein BEN78_07610 [Xanthomonas citri pv. mangiferaeindicae]|nr:hypothetical protein BEN78_07610 [Xanthomonas citri pv. mangiferaeindicae]